MKITNETRVFDGFFKINKLTVETEDGKVLEREVFDRGNAVAALVFDTVKQKYLFTKQFRMGAKHDLIEIVAGTMDVEGEIPQDCITREIGEELGYKVDNLAYIGKYFVSPGGCTEMVYIFYAEVSEKINEGGGLEDEYIETVEVDELGFGGRIFTPSKEEEGSFEGMTLRDAKSVIAIDWLERQKLLSSLSTTITQIKVKQA
jgi:ADP-ribose pyrophosphatase